MLSTRFAAAILGACAVIAPAIASAPASAAPVTEVSAKASAPVSAKKSTMDCNGVTYQHNGLSYGWGNSRNRVIYGFGSAGNIRAVKIFADGISSATWSIGVITWSNAVVESSGTGPYYCVEVPSSAKGAILTSRYNGNTVRDRVYW